MDRVFTAIERAALPKRLNNYELRRWDLISKISNSSRKPEELFSRLLPAPSRGNAAV
jgi:hypothetical protein